LNYDEGGGGLKKKKMLTWGTWAKFKRKGPDAEYEEVCMMANLRKMGLKLQAPPRRQGGV